jgi:hypothetical protein
VAIDTSTIGPPLLQFLNDRPEWSGSLTELLTELNLIAPESAKKSKFWPTLPRELSSHLQRLAPNLRQIGIHVTLGKHGNKGVLVTLERRE